MMNLGKLIESHGPVVFSTPQVTMNGHTEYQENVVCFSLDNAELRWYRFNGSEYVFHAALWFTSLPRSRVYKVIMAFAQDKAKAWISGEKLTLFLSQKRAVRL